MAVLTSTGAVFASASPARLPLAELKETGLVLHEWVVVGPFDISEEEDPWKADGLRAAGCSEKWMDSATFAGFAGGLAERGAHPDAPQVYHVREGAFLDFHHLLDRPRLKDAPPTAAYAACEINSEGERAAYLLMGSSDGARVWLNGELLLSPWERRGLNTYDDSIPVRLRAGRNFLMIKVPRLGIGWNLAARVELTVEAAAGTAMGMQGMRQNLLLKRNVLGSGEPLEIKPMGAPPDMTFPVKITDLNGATVAEMVLSGLDKIWRPGKGISNGIYHAELGVGETLYKETFCVGDPELLMADMTRRAEPFLSEERVAINLGALQRRLTVLLQPENRFSPNAAAGFWDRKVVFVLEAFEKTLRLLEQGREPFRGLPGLHLRGFRSRIDDQVQHYRLFVPKSYDPAGPGLPLVVMVATATSAARPFLESAFIAAQIEVERLGVMAERYGVGILWCGYRNRLGGSPCEFTHFDEVMEAVARDYTIDCHRVTLSGACGGGIYASMMAVRWPERFAAIGLLNPVFDRKRNSTEDMAEYIDFAAYNDWIHQNDPVESLLKLRDMPVYLLNDGGEPGHGEREVSMDFIAKARAVRFPAELDQKSQTLSQHFGAWEDILRWLSKQSRAYPSSRRDTAFFSTSLRPGPVARAFAERFVVVTGTLGSSDDQEAVAALRNQFQEAWKLTHFASCRVVPDVELTADDERNSNLVLLGSAETNAIWRRYAHLIPVTLERDGVKIGGRRWKGTGLSVQAVFLHPGNPERQIVVVGAKDPAKAIFGTMNLSIDGWFDCAVWENDMGVPMLLAAENYHADAP